MAFFTRPLKPADAAAVVALLDVLGYPAEPAKVRDRLALLDGDEACRAWAGIVGGRVAGCCVVRRVVALEYDRPIVQIINLAVLPEYQRAGLGARLLAQAEAWAVEEEARLVNLTSSHHRQAAHAFYTRHGYAETGVRLAKEMPPSSGC